MESTKVCFEVHSRISQHTLTLLTDLRDDVLDECSKFGKVLDVKIPRPAGARTSPGVGKIYVKFETAEAAQKALAALAGRKYADRTVVVTYFSEVGHTSIGKANMC
jgi:splicing factor U2AF subunit